MTGTGQREQRAFFNGLRILRAIDMHELVGHGLIEAGDTSAYQAFSADPIRWACRLDLAGQRAFWDLLQSRQTPELRVEDYRPKLFRPVLDEQERFRIHDHYTPNLSRHAPVDMMVAIDAPSPDGIVPLEVLVKPANLNRYVWLIRGGQRVDHDVRWWEAGQFWSLADAEHQVLNDYRLETALGMPGKNLALSHQLERLATETIARLRADYGPDSVLAYVNGPEASTWSAMILTRGDMEDPANKIVNLPDTAKDELMPIRNLLQDIRDQAAIDRGAPVPLRVSRVTFSANGVVKVGRGEDATIFRVDPDQGVPTPAAESLPEPEPGV